MTERVQGLSYLQKLLAKFLTVLLTAKFGSKLGGNYCGCLHDGDTRSLVITGDWPPDRGGVMVFIISLILPPAVHSTCVGIIITYYGGQCY